MTRTMFHVAQWSLGSAMIAGVLTVAVISARAEETPAPAPTAEDTLVLHDPMEGLDKDVPKDRSVMGSDKLKFEEGKVGNCLHFAEAGGSIRYPKAVIPCQEGTVEMWLAFDQSPDTFDKQKIVMLWPTRGYHDNSIELLVGGESDWGKQLLFKICDKDKKRFNISTSIAEWKPGEWHHAAMTWKLNAEGKSTMALYLDRKLVRQLTDQTIMLDTDVIAKPNTDRECNYVWFCSGNGSGFKMDELKIYKVKREYTE